MGKGISIMSEIYEFLEYTYPSDQKCYKREIQPMGVGTSNVKDVMVGLYLRKERLPEV
jgi:hypothetical protein